MPSPAGNSPNFLLLLHRHSDSPPRSLACSTPFNSTPATLALPLPCPVHKTVIPHRIKRFIRFCKTQHVRPLPATSRTATYFATALHKQGMAPATIFLYLSAVSACHQENGFADPCKDNPLLTLVKRGVTRSSKRPTPTHHWHHSQAPHLPTQI